MPGTWKLITLVGTSRRSFAHAVGSAVADAGKTLRGLSWFEVDDLRGRIENGKVAEYQVTLRAGFKVEGSASPARRGSRRRS